MSKNKSTLSQLGEMDIVYKLRWFILIGIIIFVSIIIIVKTNMDNEYQKYGYTGFSDNIKYDEWTNEIIPKNEIQTYNNDMKYITKSNGEKVYFADIKAQLNAYEKLQENYASINQENLEQVKNICDTIFSNYFEMQYTIEKNSSGTSYIIYLRDFTANGKYYNSYRISAGYEMMRIIKYLVKGVYREQNGLEPDYGY